MRKNHNKGSSNGTRLSIITKTPDGIQIESISMPANSAKYDELKQFLRVHGNGSHTTNVENAINTNSIRVALLTKRHCRIEKESARLFFDSEPYERFMVLLRKHDSKSWTRQRAAENGIIWEGNVPLV
jgi:hypothetical protein